MRQAWSLNTTRRNGRTQALLFAAVTCLFHALPNWRSCFVAPPWGPSWPSAPKAKEMPFHTAFSKHGGHQQHEHMHCQIDLVELISAAMGLGSFHHSQTSEGELSCRMPYVLQHWAVLGPKGISRTTPKHPEFKSSRRPHPDPKKTEKVLLVAAGSRSRSKQFRAVLYDICKYFIIYHSSLQPAECEAGWCRLPPSSSGYALLWHLFFSAAWHLLDPHDPRPETKNFARPSRRIHAWKMCILWLSWGLLCVSALMHLPPSHFIHWWSEICINIYDLRIQTGWTRVEPSPCWRDTLLIGGCIIGLNLCFPLCLEGCSLHFASSRASRHCKPQPLQGALYQWLQIDQPLAALHDLCPSWGRSKNKAGWKLQYTGYPSIAKSNHDRMSIAFFEWDLMSASSMVWLWMHDAWCIACAQYHRTKFAPEEQHNTPTQVLFVFSSPYSPVTQNHPQLFDKTLFQSSLSKHLATTPSALNTLNHWNRFISASSPAKPPLKSMIYQVLCFSIISIIKLFYYTDIINQ